MTGPRLRRWWRCISLMLLLSGLIGLAGCPHGIVLSGGPRGSGRYSAGPRPGAEFRWPPPAPSAFYKIPRNLFGSAETFGDVSVLLELALAKAGYTEIKFYSIKNDGFAIVTRIESIHADGTCREERERWLVNSPPMFSLRDFLEALLKAKRGLYRVWAFAVTSAADRGFAAPPTEMEIKQLFSRGGASLPAEVWNLPFSRYHECLALVYEFERGDVPPPVLTVPSGLTGAQHLAAATILRGLER